LDWALVEQKEQTNKELGEKYPHVAFEILCSDYGTLVLFPEIVVSHLNQLFQFVMGTNEAKKPFGGKIYNNAFVLLLNKLIRSLTGEYKKVRMKKI
jgi:hypothetical protein